VHGARSILRAAMVAPRAGRHIDKLKRWALEVQTRTNQFDINQGELCPRTLLAYFSP
jgi:hypothetical protein